MELAVTTDMLVASVHFLPDTDPEGLGWKTLAVNLSDLAAMGAKPRWVLLAGSLPEADEAWLAAFAKGFFTLARASQVDVVGGDYHPGPAQPVRHRPGRSGAGPGPAPGRRQGRR